MPIAVSVDGSEIEAIDVLLQNAYVLIVVTPSGITRSVIVNALRKLESAGVIESRSLGMKGTHIKITNEKFSEELENLRV